MISLEDYVKSLDWRMRLRMIWTRWRWPNGVHWHCKRILRGVRK